MPIAFTWPPIAVLTHSCQISFWQAKDIIVLHVGDFISQNHAWHMHVHMYDFAA